MEIKNLHATFVRVFAETVPGLRVATSHSGVCTASASARLAQGIHSMEVDPVLDGVQEAAEEQDKVVKLRFCPETNDLMYPQATEETGVKKLSYISKSSDHVEWPDPADWCVYRRNVKHTAKDKSVVLTDVRSDPTLPRETNVECPNCRHNEAVIFCNSSERGMTLYLNCVSCEHRWKEAV